SGDVQPGVLVPGRGKPVGRKRGRDGAADDEAEVATTGDRDDPGVGGRGEIRDDLPGVARALRERAAERRAELVGVAYRHHAPVRKALEEVGRDGCRVVEEVTHVHGA